LASDGQNFFKFFWLKSQVDSNTLSFLSKMALEFFGGGDFMSFFGPEFFLNGQKKSLD